MLLVFMAIGEIDFVFFFVDDVRISQGGLFWTERPHLFFFFFKKTNTQIPKNGNSLRGKKKFQMT